jgi:UDP-GlcNAc:undecaprenyl-phosphate GlcNAc-1-phosphate transferase
MVYFLACLVFFAFFSTLTLTPLVRDVARSFGLVDIADSPRKQHRNAIPPVGGIAVLLGYLAAFGASLIGFKNAEFVLPRESETLGILSAVMIVFLTGLLDDLIELKAWQKLAGQLLGAVVAYLSGVQIHVFHAYSLEFWISLPVTVLWLIACTNAFNLVDGLDGLAAGVGLFATITVVIAALTARDLNLALATLPLAGCLLGFLRYNFNPASVFLGDCGSLSIGFFLGCCGVLWAQKSATVLGMVAPLMAMAIPLLEVLLSVCRRFLRGQPIFGADRRHIHHLLLARGLTPRRAALLVYAMCAVGAIFSLIENSHNNQFGGIIVILFCMGAWIGIQHLGYSEFVNATRLLVKGTFRNMVDVQCRLEQFGQSIDEAASLEECWEAIQAGCRDFEFSGVRLYLHGRVMETAFCPATGGQWQIRIMLPDSQYINLYRTFDNQSDAPGLALFARILENVLQRRLAAAAADSEWREAPLAVSRS